MLNSIKKLCNTILFSSSIIVTSNKIPEHWRELIADQGRTTDILNRLLYCVEVIHIKQTAFMLGTRVKGKYNLTVTERESVSHVTILYLQPNSFILACSIYKSRRNLKSAPTFQRINNH